MWTANLTPGESHPQMLTGIIRAALAAVRGPREEWEVRMSDLHYGLVYFQEREIRPYHCPGRRDWWQIMFALPPKATPSARNLWDLWRGQRWEC